jgi:phosphoglycolate phosphatase
MHPTLVLDLDGTLVDSVGDLATALNRLMASRGLAPFTVAEVTAMVGDGARALVERGFAARGVAFDEAGFGAFLRDYSAHSAVLTRPYPGVVDGLGVLQARGWRFAVCTNKPEAAAHALLEALGLSPWFAAVGGGDSFPTRKPDPRHLLATLAAAGGEPGAAVMVGDHRNDIQAGAGAGLPSIFASWGYGPPGMADGASATAGAFAEVPDLAQRLLHLAG